jgi:hypothetical protein
MQGGRAPPTRDDAGTGQGAAELSFRGGARGAQVSRRLPSRHAGTGQGGRSPARDADMGQGTTGSRCRVRVCSTAAGVEVGAGQRCGQFFLSIR